MNDEQREELGAVRCPSCEEVAMWTWVRPTSRRYRLCSDCGYHQEDGRLMLNGVAHDIHVHNVNQGFWPGKTDGNAIGMGERNVGEALMLIVSEVTEAMEHYRDMSENPTVEELSYWWLDDGKPDGFPVELVDVIIRCLDLLDGIGVDMDELLRVKLDYNQSRPYLHGRSR